MIHSTREIRTSGVVGRRAAALSALLLGSLPWGEVAAQSACGNTCVDAFDGWCDDGGPGSDYSICTYGSDCGDCGARSTGGATSGLCSNSCVDARDGWCDDGGSGSDYSICSLGSDCADCGFRPTGGGGVSDGGCAAVAPQAAAGSSRGTAWPALLALAGFALVHRRRSAQT